MVTDPVPVGFLEVVTVLLHHVYGAEVVTGGGGGGGGVELGHQVELFIESVTFLKITLKLFVALMVVIIVIAGVLLAFNLTETDGEYKLRRLLNQLTSYG